MNDLNTKKEDLKTLLKAWILRIKYLEGTSKDLKWFNETSLASEFNKLQAVTIDRCYCELNYILDLDLDLDL